MQHVTSWKLPAGAVTAIGSVAHIDADAAVGFSLSSCPDLPFVPQLVRRHPAEGMIAQVLLGVAGMDFVGDRLVLDAKAFDAALEPALDLSHQAFTGLRTFLRLARSHHGPVKWQVAGPLTVGMALLHHGVAPSDAFHVALRAVRHAARTIFDTVERELPGRTQVVFFDEPSAAAVLTAGFPLAPDDAIDVVSGALAALEGKALVGLHCCAEADLAALVAAGPAIISVPSDAAHAKLGSIIGPFLDKGGIVAWGVVPTDRPLAVNPDRYWHELSAVWCELVSGGCDPLLLRRQSLLTPACGLAHHTPEQAVQILGLTSSVASRVAEQAAATRLIIGA